MKSAEIQKGLLTWARANTSEIVVPNYYLGRFEADVLKITKAGLFTEYEIKVSRADFKKDAEKAVLTWKMGKRLPGQTKHDQIYAGKRVHRFYFVTPAGLVTPAEVPDGFGLIECFIQQEEWGTRLYFKIVKVSKLFNAQKCTEQQYRHIATNLCLKLAAAKSRMHEAETNYRSLIKASKNQ